MSTYISDPGSKEPTATGKSYRSQEVVTYLMASYKEEVSDKKMRLDAFNATVEYPRAFQIRSDLMLTRY